MSQGKITHDIFFPQESEIVGLYSIVAFSYFPSLWFKLLLDLDFFIKAKLYKNGETEIALKRTANQEQTKHGITNYNFLCFATEKDLQGLPSKSS